MSDVNAGSGDSFSQTTRVSWVQRIRNAIGGVVTGLLMIIAAGGGLFWNEGRSVQTALSLAEGRGAVVAADAARVDPAHEGRLVHVAGAVTTGSPLVDPDFGVSAQGLRLIRNVEMYQWKEDRRTETRTGLGGAEERVTVYSYTRQWMSQPQDSSRFQQPSSHQNPPMRYRDRDIVSTDATLGAFRPGENVLRKISASDDLALDPALAREIRSRVSGPVQVADGRIHLGLNAGEPRVGDHRIAYRVARPDSISVVGRQAGTGFGAYQTAAGDSLLLASAGIVPASDMFGAAERDNAFFTWLVRGIGILFIYIGFGLILRPLVVVGDFVPLIGSILSAGAGLAALALTAVVAPVIIAVAWFYYRPLLSVGVLAAGAAIVFGTRMLAARRNAARAQMQPAA